MATNQPDRRERHPHKRRKLVWKREDASQAGAGAVSAAPAAGAGASSAPATAAAAAPAAPAAPARPACGSAPDQLQRSIGQGEAPAPKAPTAKEPDLSELEALRQQVAAKERELQQARELAQHLRAGNEQEERNEERRARRSRLEAGFSQAVAEAARLAAESADLASSSVADTEEVQRVLCSRTDHEVLQVAPGASAAVIRKRYRELAVSLHPDKCAVPDATLAFQRLVAAFAALNKHAV